MPDADTDKTKRSPTGASASTKTGAAKTGGAKAGASATAKTGAAKPAAAARSATDARPAAASPAATTAATPTEEENPLHRKLRLRPEDAGVVIAPPRDEDNPLAPLPKSFLVLSRASELEPEKGPFDYIQVFARDRADLVGSFSLLVERLAPSGSLWISWLKPSSKLKGGGQPGDLNENVVRRIGLTNGLVDVNLAVLDRDWAALRLVRRKH